MVGLHGEVQVGGAIVVGIGREQQRLVERHLSPTLFLLQHQQVSTHLRTVVLEQVVCQTVGTNQAGTLQCLCQLLAVAVQVVRCNDIGQQTAVAQAVESFQHIVAVDHPCSVAAHLIVAVAISRVEHPDVTKGNVGGYKVELSEVAGRDSLETLDADVRTTIMSVLCIQDNACQ